MAVPKKKTSKSRKGMRNSHSAISKNTSHIIRNKETGEFYPRHNIDSSGKFRGIQVIMQKIKKDVEQE